MPETAIAIDTLHSSVDKDSKVVPGTQDLQSDATTANLSVSGTESRPSADDDDKTTSIDTVTDSISKLSVNPSPPVSTPLAEPSATTPTTESQKDSSEAGSKVAVTKVPAKEEDKEEELSPEETKLRAKGLKSTHRPGFYIHIDAPRRLRIQTSTTTFDLDRYCPHANADMLKWGVLRSDMTLRCGVHYWGFDLSKGGQCIAHPEESLNACPVSSSELNW